MNKDIIQTQEPNTHKVDIETAQKISKVWLIPLVALSIGLWMVYYQWSNQGPLITITFDAATNLEAGKTTIKTRNVDIGQVKKIELLPDLNGVLVTARLNSNHEQLLKSTSQFWIVTPRISLNGISGLSTLLSGPYINLEPGNEGEQSLEFIGLASPPLTPPGTPGVHVTLNSDQEFAFKEGDPVIYKGLKVGEIEDIYFNFDERVVYYNTFVKAPYHKLITENTKFWDISGVRLELGASGFKLSTGSIESLITNGVTFGIPEGMPQGKQIEDRSYFDIHRDYETASDERYKLSAEFMILVQDTVRGLQIGAPVEYRGLVVGKVLAINLEDTSQNSLLDEDFRIPVLISIQPGRVQQPDTPQGVDFVRKKTLNWVANGLKASLKTGNLLTGALLVELDHYPNKESHSLSQHMGYDVIPNVSNKFAQITEKINAILDNVNQINLGRLDNNANNMISEITASAEALQTTAAHLDKVLLGVHQDEVSGALSATLLSLQTLIKDFSGDSKNYQELGTTMKVLQKTLKDLQPTLIRINRQPNSLIFSGSDKQNIMPRAASDNKGDQ